MRAEGEADVDEHPVARRDGDAGLVHERDVHLAPHAGDVDQRVSGLTVAISTIWPGMPRHMRILAAATAA